jgi:hypothetical protein
LFQQNDLELDQDQYLDEDPDQDQDQYLDQDPDLKLKSDQNKDQNQDKDIDLDKDQHSMLELLCDFKIIYFPNTPYSNMILPMI